MLRKHTWHMLASCVLSDVVVQVLMVNGIEAMGRNCAQAY